MLGHGPERLYYLGLSADLVAIGFMQTLLCPDHRTDSCPLWRRSHHGGEELEQRIHQTKRGPKVMLLFFINATTLYRKRRELGHMGATRIRFRVKYRF